MVRRLRNSGTHRRETRPSRTQLQRPSPYLGERRAAPPGTRLRGDFRHSFWDNKERRQNITRRHPTKIHMIGSRSSESLPAVLGGQSADLAVSIAKDGRSSHVIPTISEVLLFSCRGGRTFIPEVVGELVSREAFSIGEVLVAFPTARSPAIAKVRAIMCLLDSSPVCRPLFHKRFMEGCAIIQELVAGGSEMSDARFHGIAGLIEGSVLPAAASMLGLHGDRARDSSRGGRHDTFSRSRCYSRGGRGDHCLGSAFGVSNRHNHLRSGKGLEWVHSSVAAGRRRSDCH